MSLLQSNPEIKSKIQELWNKFWSGGISNPLTAIEQITYLLFMKKLDENDTDAQSRAEFNDDPFTSRFEGEFQLPNSDLKIEKQQLRWSEFKRLPAEEMLQRVQQYVFPFIKTLDTDDSPFVKHMRNAVFIIPKPSLLVEAVKIIDEIYEEMERDASEKGQDFQDIQGDVYEYLLSEIASAGKNGQFRTPRHIIKLLVELVSPQLGNRIVDPACGTGGFLLDAYQYLVTQLDKDNKNREKDEDGFIRSSKASRFDEKTKTILNQSLQGYDIDQTMVRLGLMNLMMHGIESPQIDYTDTLSKSYNESSQYDVVLANPPFTGNIDKGDINESLQLGTTKTELLFIERIYQMLRMGGTAGIVVPQGVLFGSGRAFVEARKLMIEKSELKAVITAPSGVFKPYAGVSTALLIFTKGGETENVWFYDMQSDGYTLDDKRAKLKLKDGSDDYGDLQDIVIKYNSKKPASENDRKRTHFTVPKKEIVAEGYDLSFSRYKEEVYDEIIYDKPNKILLKLLGGEDENGNVIEGLEKEISEKLNELKELF
ncbi:type I restriction-modification system subunit M [Maribacter hydrothermalis]|uniref:site-specific DNA-methyltransferase (adenine-specific) n=1 Tax=Maribacter hydrothermalis TaxID=1836467 RepID=A0A1B7ZD31_9FLAO|nr:class I SAM-dependent DNA methyltransferase [Maribacter hydrothermalis]APQ18789.1 DNA methyltransferase [Maribacter hydrothermalis]OBR41033.1 DNA methyltransferase [Maribacter hydrothermalis]